MHFVTTLIHSLGTETYGLVWEPCPAWVGHRPLNSQIGETSKVSDNYLGSIPEGNTPWVLTYNDHYRDHGEFPAKGVDDLLALCELKELVEVAVITVHRDGHGSETDLENLISGFEAHDIPTEVIWPKYWSLEKEKAIQGE